MKRNLLSARDAAWLAQTMRRRRDEFGGWRMEAAGPAPESGGEGGNPSLTPDPADAPLGEGGKKALDAEREARKSAEQSLGALRGEFETFKTSLVEALGVKAGKAGETDALAAVQEQVAQMQRENAVLRLATEHNISDKDDLDLMRSATDEQAMAKLAGRLAAKAATPGTPQPDPSQGGSGEPTKVDPGPGLPRLQAAYAAAEDA